MSIYHVHMQHLILLLRTFIFLFSLETILITIDSSNISLLSYGQVCGKLVIVQEKLMMLQCKNSYAQLSLVVNCELPILFKRINLAYQQLHLDHNSPDHRQPHNPHNIHDHVCFHNPNKILYFINLTFFIVLTNCII